MPAQLHASIESLTLQEKHARDCTSEIRGMLPGDSARSWSTSWHAHAPNRPWGLTHERLSSRVVAHNSLGERRYERLRPHQGIYPRAARWVHLSSMFGPLAKQLNSCDVHQHAARAEVLHASELYFLFAKLCRGLSG